MFRDPPLVNLNCSLCDVSFDRKRSVHRMNLRRGYRIFFCSPKCRKGYEKIKAKETCIERFWNKVDKTPGLGPNGDCWEWRGFIPKSNPYGRYKINQENWMVHQYSYYLANHTLPQNTRKKILMHSCDNPPCVNPAHLKQGTYQENSTDMTLKNRQAKGPKINNAKLTETKVKTIRALYSVNKRLYSSVKLGKIFGVASTTITNIIKRKTWKHL